MTDDSPLHPPLADLDGPTIALLRRHNMLRGLVQRQIIAETVASVEPSEEELKESRTRFARCVDVHGFDAAVADAKAAGAEAVLHCGDLVAPSTLHSLEKYQLPIHVIHGNNTGDLYALTQLAHKPGGVVRFHGMDAGIELAGRRIFIVHYPHYARAMAATGAVAEITIGASLPLTGAFSIAGAKHDWELVIGMADAFVGPSTGPMHAAAALGVRTVAIFSPVRVQSPARWGPWRAPQAVVCEPEGSCPAGNRCLGRREILDG